MPIETVGTPPDSKARRGARPQPVSYDFRRPTKLSREQSRALQIVSETFARQWSTQFTALLRGGQVSPGTVSQRSYGEYVDSLPVPSLLVLLNAKEVEGTFTLHLEHQLAMAIVDRLLGGAAPVEQPTRPPTQIELSLLRGLLERIVGELTYAFAAVTEVTARIGQLETNPQFAQVAGAADTMVVAGFEVVVGDVVGAASLALPLDVFGPLLAPSDGADLRAAVPDANAEKLMHGVPVEIGARLRPVTLTSEALLQLAPGDLVRLTHSTDEPLTLVAGGQAFARAVPTQRRQRLACLVVDPRKDTP